MSRTAARRKGIGVARMRWLGRCFVACGIAGLTVTPLAAAVTKPTRGPERAASLGLTVEHIGASEIAVVKNDGSGCLRFDLDVHLSSGDVRTEGDGTEHTLPAQHVVRAPFPSKLAGGIGALRIFRCPDSATAHPLTLPDVFLFQPGYAVVIAASNHEPIEQQSLGEDRCALPEITPGVTIPTATEAVLAAGCSISAGYQPVPTAAQQRAALHFAFGGFAEKLPVSPPCCFVVTPPITNVLPGTARGGFGGVYLVNTLTAATPSA
jgi:hypothetical protein